MNTLIQTLQLLESNLFAILFVFINHTNNRNYIKLINQIFTYFLKDKFLQAIQFTFWRLWRNHN